MRKVELRKATSEDAEQVFSWRNHQKTRKYFFDSKPLSWQTHVLWFNETLSRKDKCLLIGEIDNQPIGVLRFDNVDSVAKISIYLVPELHGEGLGSCLLEAGCNWVQHHYPGTKKIQAHVLTKNSKSLKMLNKKGFFEASRIFELDLS
jgi:RimJ/RimL family protein N-acetyltransferase